MSATRVKHGVAPILIYDTNNNYNDIFSDSSPQGSNKTDRHGKENSQEKSKRRKSLELHEKRSRDTFNRTHPPPQISEVVHEKKNSLDNKTADGQNRKDSKEKKKIREITSPLKFHRVSIFFSLPF